MTEQEVHFLDAGCYLRRDEDAAIDLTGESTATFSGKGDRDCAGRFGGANTSNHVLAVSRRRDTDGDIA
jgi:hypothetical protein